MELEPALRFGLGINAPFGLKTDYDPTWVGRFQAINSKIQTVNLNPSLAYQMNDSVSLGVRPELSAHHRRSDQCGELQRGGFCSRWCSFIGGDWRGR